MADDKKAAALELFKESGLNAKQAEETVRNPHLTEALVTVIHEV